MIITKMNGKEIDFTSNGVYWLSHTIPSVEHEHETEQIDGLDGLLFIDTKLTTRNILARFLYIVEDIGDFYLLRDEVNALFNRRESFYITFKEEPYKRWLVRLSSRVELPPNFRAGEFEIEFTCVKPYAQSIASTADKKLWDINKWAWNNSITWDDDLQYSFNTNSFKVNNRGTAPINPKSDELKITVKGNFPSGFTLINDTTGENYKFNSPLTANDTLIIQGVRTTKNNVAMFAQTNKRVIKLAVGENDFRVQGGTLTSIEFDFRFLYA